MKKNLILFSILFSLTLYSQEKIDYAFENEMYSKSLSELRLLRNEIYARKGYIFSSEDLKKHFSEFDWYKPTKTINEINLSEIEQIQVNLIKRIEQEKSLNKKRIKTLKLLSKIPEVSMKSWEWSAEDRIEFINSSIEAGYLINDNSGMLQKKFVSDNHLFIQVVDGALEYNVVEYEKNKYYIITNDIVGDSNFIQTYNVESSVIKTISIEKSFPKGLFDFFLKKTDNCLAYEDLIPLRVTIKDDLLLVNGWYEDECLIKKEITFKLNTSRLIYELID